MSPAGPGPFAGRPLLRRALPPVVTLVFVVVSTIAGFVGLAGIGVIEAAYWVISPTEVGLYFGGRAGPERAAKALAVLSRVGLVVVGFWLGQTVVAALFGGQITEELKRVQQQRTIGTLSEHVVVCGYGMFGQTVAERLEGDRRVVVVERDEDYVAAAERDGHLVVDGDARQEASLERANVGAAATVVAAIDNSNAPEAELIVRIGDRIYESTARRAGADVVVIPEVVSGDDVADHLRAVE
ncbi:MAG: potassium channel protein [Halobacteriales archaeon SW_8_66_22]|nr:MAG: potassium channel protein [Halobacteriales archaeon SW_8_66_22]